MKLISSVGLLAFSLCFAIGCSRQVTPKPVLKAGIESYYQSHPACLWMTDKTFPVKATAAEANYDGYNALADQGLLTRTAMTRHESTYALSAEGRKYWVNAPNDPGAGNLCYGHRQVVSIDHATPVPDQPGYSSMVSYHYKIADAPAWASAPEMEAAFPKLSNDAAPQLSIATLTNTNNHWQMNPPFGSAATQQQTASTAPTPGGSKAVAHKSATD